MKNNSDEIYKELMSKLLAYSCQEDMPSLLRDNANVMGVYFNTLDKGSFSDFKYSQLWYAIQQNIKQNHKNWFYRYWEFADQYYSLEFHFETNKSKERFREFHIAVGGLLALNEKYEWIEHIAWFTNELPPSYFLIPNTFTQIMDWLIHFSKLVDDPNVMVSRFHLYSAYEGVKAGANLYLGIVRYLALMMCRLPKVNYNVVYTDPMAIPPIYGQRQEQSHDYVEINQRNIRLANNLEKVIKEIKTISDDDRTKIINLIDEYITACKAMMKQQGEVDMDKIVHIKETLLCEFNRQSKNQILSRDSDLKSYEKRPWFSFSQDVLEKQDFLEGELYNNINRESVMIGLIMQDTYRKYANIFNDREAKYTFMIRFSDLKEALNKFSVTNEYVYLVSGISYSLLPEGFHNKANVHAIFTRQSEIIIIRKDKLPFVCFEEKTPSDKTMKLIDPENNKVLYSNIEQLDGNNTLKQKSIFMLKVGCHVSICVPEGEMSFVRIKANGSITQDTFDLNRITNVANLQL